MIMTIVSSLLGFGTSFIPELLTLWRDRGDKKHELALLQLQMQAQAQGHQERLAEVQIAADAAEFQVLHAPQQLTGVVFIDGLRGSVRPVITYAYFALFAVVTAMTLSSLIQIGIPATEAFVSVWKDGPEQVFAIIISYWFGRRDSASRKG